MQYKVEKISEVWDEILPLFEKHNNEVGLPGSVLNPAKNNYFAADAKGNLHFIVVRNNDGEIVGYSMFFVGPHHQYLDSLTASQEAFYLKPDYRGITAMKLFSFVEKDLLTLGVKYILRQSCVGKDWSRTLIRTGYLEKETLYVKRVG